MPTDVVAFTVLHLLIFAYWLGGDAGVFYSSLVVTDGKRSPEARITAAKILLNVDMVPRICLLLALPTGLALAASKGWVALTPIWIVLAFVAAAAWITLIFKLHSAHGAKLLTGIDTIGRIALLAGLAGAGVLGLMNTFSWPTFLSVKLLILAGAVAMGLLVRLLLRPFGPAFAAMVANGPTPETDAVIKGAIARSRGPVVAIWILLIAAATFGVATPV
ncbi:MAG: hypothetical protein AAGC95_17205 [Pseudomonadota bacterium]